MKRLISSAWANWVVLLLYLIAAVNAFGAVNTAVSLKYETNGPPECISLVTGRNLCADLQFCKYMALACFGLGSVLLAGRLYALVWGAPKKPSA